MSITGLGQGGSFQVQKETAYNTLATNAMTFLPLESGTLTYEIEKIMKKNIINSAVPQKPQAGRKKVGASDIAIQIAPELFGMFMNLCFGASTNGSVTDSAYEHTWLVPFEGESVGVSWSVRQHIGQDLGRDFAGIKCTKWVVKCGNDGIITLTMTLVGVDLNNNAVARPTTITVSSTPYYTFANGSVAITPSGESVINQKFNNFELSCDFGYLENGQRFQIGSDSAVTPIFGTIPTVEFKGNIDAELRYQDWADAQKDFAIDISIVSTTLIGVTSVYRADFEIPVAQLKSSTKIESTNDNLPIDLEFEVYGGTTTGSGTDVVQMEVRCTDDTATYTGY